MYEKFKGDDLTFRKFNYFSVLGYIGKGYWECVCECGNKFNARTNRIIENYTKSCGCHKRRYINKYKKIKSYWQLIIVDKETYEEIYVEFDSIDLDKIIKNYWRPHSDGRKYGIEQKERISIRGNKGIYIHQLIMGDKLIDHIDGNPLKNRRNNLRKTTTSENALNRQGPNVNNSTGYRNVRFDKRNNNYNVKLVVKGIKYEKGGFNTAEEANEYAIKLREEKGV